MKRYGSPARLKEYGFYIRKAKTGYNLGFSSGAILKNFPTYEEAYNAVEEALDYYWDLHGDSFANSVENFFRRM